MPTPPAPKDDPRLIDIDLDLYARLVALDAKAKARPDADDSWIDTSPDNLVEIALEAFLNEAEWELRML